MGVRTRVQVRDRRAAATRVIKADLLLILIVENNGGKNDGYVRRPVDPGSSVGTS